MSEQEPNTVESSPRRPRRPRRLRRIVWSLLAVLALLVVVLAAAGWFWWARDIPDPFPEYALELDVSAPGGGAFRAGAARVDITPAVTETWTDLDGDGEYEPDKGETFHDADGDGVFDAVWIAGFGTGRAATGVHDPLWARAVVIESGGVRLGLVAVDLVGLFHTSVIRIRNAIAEKSGGERPLVDYLLVASTHNHEGPDTLGLWGPDYWTSGVDPAYLARVEGAVLRALEESVASLRPARARFRSSPFGSGVVMQDWRRKPFVIDDVLAVAHLTEPDSGATIATWVRWSCHPETLGDELTLISSDFPHWLRERVEAELGGTCVFMNGAIGGMMTSLSMDLPHPDTGEVIPAGAKEGPGLPWDRPRAVGEAVAREALRLLGEEAPGDAAHESPRLHIRARTFFVSMKNLLFRIGGKLGRLDRGSFDGRMRTEASVIDLGLFRLAGVPGELYPEVFLGGIETPPGADFHVPPVEVPPLAEALAAPGVDRVLVIGLANDELGYFIPKSEWDAPAGLPWDEDGNPPYLYGADKPPYGEINSCGPDAAAEVHRAILSLARGGSAAARE